MLVSRFCHTAHTVGGMEISLGKIPSFNSWLKRRAIFYGDAVAADMTRSLLIHMGGRRKYPSMFTVAVDRKDKTVPYADIAILYDFARKQYGVAVRYGELEAPAIVYEHFMDGDGQGEVTWFTDFTSACMKIRSLYIDLSEYTPVTVSDVAVPQGLADYSDDIAAFIDALHAHGGIDRVFFYSDTIYAVMDDGSIVNYTLRTLSEGHKTRLVCMCRNMTFREFAKDTPATRQSFGHFPPGEGIDITVDSLFI